jgi:hypothetical protein
MHPAGKLTSPRTLPYRGGRSTGGSTDLQDRPSPHNCLFDEFRRIYDMAYDLAIEGSYYLSPKSGKLGAL